MSFREKRAWASLAILALVCGAYIAGLKPGLEMPVWRLIGCILALVVLETGMIAATAAVTAVCAPADLDAPLDERERLIELKGAQAGFMVLSAGVVLSIGALALFGVNAGQLANAVLLSLAAAEAARYGVQLRRFRQDA